MGYPRLSGEMVEAFKSDWALGIPLEEMAAMYEYRNINSVSRTAFRLGLRPRIKRVRKTLALVGGQWEKKPGGISVWIPDAEAS